MDARLFHIFRNTPLGRETLLQSTYFCQTLDLRLVVFIPETTKFLMYFDNDVVQVDLDESYLKSPDTALNHATRIAEHEGLGLELLKPKSYTASTLPDIPTNFDFMACPRSISDLSSKIGLGYIGPVVRRIVRSARFPVLIPSPVFKKWHSIEVFFGGSANAVNALRLGIRLSRLSGMPLDVFTQVEKDYGHTYERILQEEGLEEDMNRLVRQWRRFETGRFADNLYEVPHDALVVLGAYGHGLIRELVFGSKMEEIQATVSNSLLIVGPAA